MQPLLVHYIELISNVLAPPFLAGIAQQNSANLRPLLQFILLGTTSGTVDLQYAAAPRTVSYARTKCECDVRY